MVFNNRCYHKNLLNKKFFGVPYANYFRGKYKDFMLKFILKSDPNKKNLMI